jgi:hypothetical protein
VSARIRAGSKSNPFLCFILIHVRCFRVPPVVRVQHVEYHCPGCKRATPRKALAVPMLSQDFTSYFLTINFNIIIEALRLPRDAEVVILQVRRVPLPILIPPPASRTHYGTV